MIVDAVEMIFSCRLASLSSRNGLTENVVHYITEVSTVHVTNHKHSMELERATKAVPITVTVIFSVQG